MASVRRWYQYLVCAISLQVTAWAVIALLQNLIRPGFQSPLASIAFQIAVIVIGLPVYLGHWLSAQRRARQDVEEGSSAVRYLYLYGMLAAFLAPFLWHSFDLAALWLGQALDANANSSFASRSTLESVVAMAVLGLLWWYHQREVAHNMRAYPPLRTAAGVRRLYALGFSATGLILTLLGVIDLVRWLLFQLSPAVNIVAFDNVRLASTVASLMIGLPVWLLFWRWAQRLFTVGGDDESESALRKLYLYIFVFTGALSVVSNVTFILAGVFRRVLGLSPEGDIREPLPIILAMAVLWAFHGIVLRDDAARATEAPRQATVRRLYLYLIAAIGLAAFVIGVAGDITVLIQLIGATGFGLDQREPLAWYTAALIAGLPVWLLPWRAAGVKAAAAGVGGIAERRSVVRKIYLYFYLFVAIMTVLSSAVYIVYRLLGWVLGALGPADLVAEMAQALAFGLIAGGLWFYHGQELQRDGRLNRREQSEHLGRFKVAILDTGDGKFGRALADGLRRELPGLNLVPIGLTPQAMEAMGTPAGERVEQLAGAGLIVGPWNIAITGTGPDAVSPALAQAVVDGPARKLLVPVQTDCWDWVGVDRLNADEQVRQTIEAIKLVAEGASVKPSRPMSAAGIVGIVAVVLVILIVAIIAVMIGFRF